MTRRGWPSAFLIVIALFSSQLVAQSTTSAGAQPCQGPGVEGDLSGSADIAVIVGREASSCTLNQLPLRQQKGPYYTLEITCSPDHTAALDGICSATPCPSSFFALRTIHYPNGQAEPAGFRCVTVGQAMASPGVTVAQVFEAVRRVKLPGGEIGVAPEVRGLANLESFFWCRGRHSRRLTFGWWVDGSCGVSGG
jgi:hypothetical protein